MQGAERLNIRWDDATLEREERRLAAIVRAVAMVEAEANRGGELMAVMLPGDGRQPEAWTLAMRVPQ